MRQVGDLGRTDLQAELVVGGVDRALGGLDQVDATEAVVAEVLDRLLQARELLAVVAVQAGVQRDPGLQGGSQHVRLERRSRLPARALPGEVEARAVGTAVVGPDLTRPGLDRDERTLQVVPAGPVPGDLLDRGDRGVLGALADGGLDRQASDRQPVLGEAVLRQLLQDRGDDVALRTRQVVVAWPGADREHRGEDLLLAVRRGQPPLLHHAVEHVPPPVAGVLGVLLRVQPGRTADDRGQHRALRHRELAGRLAEVGAGRHLDATGLAAEVDGVEVVLEDLRLLHRAGHLQRDEHLLHLAGVRPLGGQEGVLGVLLGDGRAALLDLSAPADVGQQRSRDALRADARLAVEAAVLRGQHRQLHVLGDLRDAYGDAVLGADPAELGAVGVQDAGRRRGRARARQRHIGEGVAHPDERHDAEHGAGAAEQHDALPAKVTQSPHGLHRRAWPVWPASSAAPSEAPRATGPAPGRHLLSTSWTGAVASRAVGTYCPADSAMYRTDTSQRHESSR